MDHVNSILKCLAGSSNASEIQFLVDIYTKILFAGIIREYIFSRINGKLQNEALLEENACFELYKLNISEN